MIAAALSAAFIGCVWIAGFKIAPLGWIILGTHELGHLLSGGMSDPAQAVSGSVAQLLFPLALLLITLITKRLVLLPIALLWLSYSLLDLSTYIADAPHQELPLVGLTKNPQHDWAFLLSSQAWGGLDQAAVIASRVRLAGEIAAGLAIGLPLLWIARPPLLHKSSHLNRFSGGGLRGLGEQLRRDGVYSDDDDYERDFSGGRERKRWEI